MYKDKFIEGIKIKVIGGSIAAGAGSSLSYKTEELILEDDGQKFYKRIAPNSWYGLFEEYLKENYSKCTIENKGCGGIFSYQIKKHLDTLISDDDDMVIISMGLNDRKRPNGMQELRDNFESIIDSLVDKDKMIILLMPTQSVHSNEYYPNRLFHTDEVVEILSDIAVRKKITIVDYYKYIKDYLAEKKLMIDDIIYGEGCSNDGLHPSDFVYKLMFHYLIDVLQV